MIPKYFVYYLCICTCLGSVCLNAQRSPINFIRYFDDFSYLLEPDADSTRRAYERLKYLPLSTYANVSLGGEVRAFYQYFNNANFGDNPPNVEPDRNGHLWHRLMVHAYWQWGKEWRAFTQLNSTFAIDKNIITTIDENRLGVHQAFLAWRPQGRSGFFTQIGRQEFGRGTQLTIGPREGPNNRLAFDAILLGVEREKVQGYVFFATPIIQQPGVFDDGHIDEYIWTAYLTRHLSCSALDMYYFGFHSKETSYNYERGIENRQTIGLRWWRNAQEGWDFSIEPAFQFGSFNSENIVAFNWSSDISYKFSRKLANWAIGITLNYITGDKSPDDEQLNTYNALYSRPSFGLAAPIGPSNIVNIRPFVVYQPSQHWQCTASVYWQWRQSIKDGTYTPGRTQVRPIPVLRYASDRRGIGQQLALDFNYQLNINWSFALGGAYFIPASYIQATGAGLDILYLSSRATFKF